MMIKKCRMCKSSKLQKFLDLGFTPAADGFLRKWQLNEPEAHYPLDVLICSSCSLIQIGYNVPPEILYKKNYPYESWTTETGKRHFFQLSENICRRFYLKKKSLVIDIGSNVGVLLSGFKSQGMNVLGIDPAENIAKLANQTGIETWADYFSSKTARKVLKQKGKASVITATNVFAHLYDLHDALKSIGMLLGDDGIFVFEAPYFTDLLDKLEYDTIYHEHLCYISIRPLIPFFRQANMDVFDAERVSIHGGSVRIFVCRKGRQKISENIGRLLKLEESKKIYSLERLRKFANDVRRQKYALVSLLLDLKKKGKKIAGVSAPAKGNTLLNYCGIDNDMLDFLTEKAKIKIGLYSPGMHIPVVSDEELLKHKPDYALLLAWNFADEIIKNLDKFRKNGGKFIIPIPFPKIV